MIVNNVSLWLSVPVTFEKNKPDSSVQSKDGSQKTKEEIFEALKSIRIDPSEADTSLVSTWPWKSLSMDGKSLAIIGSLSPVVPPGMAQVTQLMLEDGEIKVYKGDLTYRHKTQLWRIKKKIQAKIGNIHWESKLFPRGTIILDGAAPQDKVGKELFYEGHIYEPNSPYYEDVLNLMVNRLFPLKIRIEREFFNNPYKYSKEELNKMESFTGKLSSIIENLYNLQQRR